MIHDDSHVVDTATTKQPNAYTAERNLHLTFHTIECDLEVLKVFTQRWLEGEGDNAMNGAVVCDSIEQLIQDMSKFKNCLADSGINLL